MFGKEGVVKVAVVRGKFLNPYEMQSFAPLVNEFDLTAFSSLLPFPGVYPFPVVKLPSPMDIPNIPYKMPILNRLCIDAHYLWGLEEQLKGFDIVHSAETYYHYTQQSLNARRRGYVKKVIATVLETIPYNNEGIWGRKAFKKRAREELDHLIALTEKSKQALITEGTRPEKITVIGHGIDTEKFFPDPKPPTGNGITILFSGRLESYKGIYDLLSAFERLLLDSDVSEYSLKLILVGEGAEKRKLRQLIDRRGLTQIVTQLSVPYDDMPALYRQADMFIAPSKPTATWEEQYCTALLEAQSSGLAIVTTRSGGIPENVGDAALLSTPGDVQSLYESLKRFVLDARLRRTYGKKARARALAVHDARRIADRIAGVYRNLF